jgi:hypothetical protein
LRASVGRLRARSPADCLTAAFAPKLPLDLCRQTKLRQLFTNASRSLLIVSAWVVAMPCGKPG